MEVLEEGKNSETIPATEKHLIKTQFKWASQQVEELKRFGNFHETYFDGKPTS